YEKRGTPGRGSPSADSVNRFRLRCTLSGTNLIQYVIQEVRAVDSIDDELLAGRVEETLPVCVFQHLGLLFRIEFTPVLSCGQRFFVLVTVAEILGPQRFAHVIGSTMLILPNVAHFMNQCLGLERQRSLRNINGVAVSKRPSERAEKPGKALFDF